MAKNTSKALFILSQFNLFEYGCHAHISNTPNILRTRPQRVAPELFLPFGKMLKHEASGRSFQPMGHVCRCDSRRSSHKQMNVIFLHMETRQVSTRPLHTGDEFPLLPTQQSSRLRSPY